MRNRFINLLFFLLVFLVNVKTVFSQQEITFIGKDSLVITADYYRSHTDDPWVLFFHQAGYSRGEFNEIARKVQKMGFHCLAVDLRTGDEVNYTRNETARRAREMGLESKMIDAEKDILAAIDYVSLKTKKAILLFGSSFSASLCMMVATNDTRVKGVMAFSPGEFFQPGVSVREKLKEFDKPLFVAASSREYPFVKEMIREVPSKNVTLVKPSGKYDGHGASMLWDSSTVSDEIWLSLMLFFRKMH
ncbi:MAG: dienelactone hydrolase family protein [Bacteroidales bacterium]